jgi:serine/threonine-protein kinase
MILVLPKDHVAWRHIKVLRRVSQGRSSLPEIVDCAVKDDHVFLITKWVEGISLRRYLDHAIDGKTAWPSPTEVFHRYARLAHSLSQMHQHGGIVHGDLKPENLIYTTGGSHWITIDFGSAWAIENSVQKAPGDGKTAGYSSPEQLLADQVAGFASDQFSATVILYEMLTGQLPYGGIGGAAALPENRQAFADSLLPPSQQARETRFIPREVWDSIDRVVTKALALDSKGRFQSGSEWRNAVDQARRSFEINTPTAADAGPVNRVIYRLLEWLAGSKQAD